MNGTPPVIKNLLIINVLFFMADNVLSQRGVDLTQLFGLYFFGMEGYFHIWQPVTYMFMHGSLSHIFFNMFALWMFGRILEAVWGGRRFLTYYMVCGVGAAIIQELVQLLTFFHSMGTGVLSYSVLMPTVGASGAIYGILLAFAMLFPNEKMFIFPLPVPVKAKYFVAFFFVLELFSGFAVSDNVAHFAHLGGMLFGWALLVYWKRKNRYGGNYRRF